MHERGEKQMKYGIDEKHVKIIGRTLTDRGIRWFGASGSGIDFFLKARSAKLLFDGDDTTLGNTLGGPARIAIYMDGTKVRDFLLTEPQMEVTLWDEKETEEKVFAAEAAKTELAPPVQPVRITVVKLSECSVSLMGIEAVETDDAAEICPAPERKRKIEFIGDSITCGFGVDLEKPDTEFESRTQDFTKTYAYKTAGYLDADYGVVAFSGYGVLSGFTDNGEKNTFGLIPPLYDKIGFSNGKVRKDLTPETAEWDFERFVPQLIVINLGTNDTCYCQTDEAKQQEFQNAYVQFLKQVRQKNPQAKMLCIEGTMGTIMAEPMRQAVLMYREETGDLDVYPMPLPEQLLEDGLVTGNHPTERTHEKTAQMIVPKIREIMGWIE